MMRWQKELQRRKAIAAARHIQQEMQEQQQQQQSAQRIKDTAILNEKLRGLAG